MNLSKEIICPYCGSHSIRFKYSEVNAIYRTDENGYPISLPEDTTNHYYCNNCHRYFETNGVRQFKEKYCTQGNDENSTDQKLDKIIDLLEKLIVKL